MIAPTMLEKSLYRKSEISQEVYTGLNSVLAAAVVNQSFRDMLLQNPEAALDQGYLGKGFSLNQKETSLILSLSANSLADLAKQIISFSEDRP